MLTSSSRRAHLYTDHTKDSAPVNTKITMSQFFRPFITPNKKHVKSRECLHAKKKRTKNSGVTNSSSFYKQCTCVVRKWQKLGVCTINPMNGHK